jgi:hypothetical protein
MRELSTPRRTTTHAHPIVALAAVVAIVGGPVAAGATQYAGHGDTDWVHVGKRDCCNDAIGRAQEASVIACENAGGVPSPTRGGVQRRGYCAWESARDDDGVVVYRCQAEARVWCR